MEDERKLATSFLSNLRVLYESLGDKTLQAQSAINLLNSRTKTQLQFEGIKDRTDLITQAKKYIREEKMLQDTSAKAKYMLRRVNDLRIIFRNVFENGIPNFWDEHGMFLLEIDY